MKKHVNSNVSEHILLKQYIEPFFKERSAELAYHLLQRFGTIQDLMQANIAQYPKELDETPALYQLLNVTALRSRRMLENSTDRRKRWSHETHLNDLARTTLNSSSTMLLRGVYLNEDDEFLGTEILATGSYNSLTYYEREVVSRCLIWSASRLILIHTNPKASHVSHYQYRSQAIKLMLAASKVDIDFSDYYFVSTDYIDEILAYKKTRIEMPSDHQLTLF